MRLAHIDVLKGIAIIAIVFYHYGYLHYGYLGVDVFLVISGYFTTKSLLRTYNSSNCVSGFALYKNFVWNRIIRLLPILLLACYLSMVIGYFIMLPYEYNSLSESVIATNFFSNNILSAITLRNYWSELNDFKPLMHTWYAGLLMQFYIIYPLVFIVTKKLKTHRLRSLILLNLTLSFISLLFFIGVEDNTFDFYYIPSRFFEFSFGGVLALISYKTDVDVFNNTTAFVVLAVLTAMLVINLDYLSGKIKLLIVVLCTVILIASGNIFQRIKVQSFFCQIGVASFSIYVWHQVVIAFYRCVESRFISITGFCVTLLLISLMSWMTYLYVEKKLPKIFQYGSKIRLSVYAFIAIAFVVINVFSICVYTNKGVMHDFPELNIKQEQQQDGSDYNYVDRVFKLDKDFETDRLHWLIIGNSFGRDLANVILESNIADNVELSYVYVNEYKDSKKEMRFKSADKIFISSLSFTDDMVRDIEILAYYYGKPKEDIIIVGEKNFGEIMSQPYSHRFWESDYYNQSVQMIDGYLERNNKYKSMYGERFVDMISVISKGNNKVRVFDENNKFLSFDSVHLTRSGAIYYATHIDWSQYL